MQLRNVGKDKWFVIRSLLTNPFGHGKLVYIVEAREWAIHYVGQQITAAFNQLSNVGATTSSTDWALQHKIIHYGSLHTILKNGQPRLLQKSNKHILTVFHLVPDKTNTKVFRALANSIDLFHTASHITKQQLIIAGIPAEKIVVIPLGVDTNLFQPASAADKTQMRRKFNIPDSAFVIGSFQKDGVGWQAGTTPKLEKGPDVFVNVVKKVAKGHPIHVLLVGPARGYVEQGLREAKVAYTNVGYLETVEDVAPYYAALDAYLVSSRIEGGPLSLFESWASKVPIISTAVGLVPDVARDGVSVLLAPVEDIGKLTQHLNHVIEDRALRQRLVESAFQQVQQYGWSHISRRYFMELYKPLLEKL